MVNWINTVSFVLHQLVIGPIHNISSRGQKCWDLSSSITKTSKPSPSMVIKLQRCSGWVEMSPFWAQHWWGRGRGVGDGWLNPKPIKKLSLGAESYETIPWKSFFTQSRVLLTSIVWNWFRVIKWNFCYLSPQRDGKTFALELSKCSTVVFSKMIFDHSWWSVCLTKELWIRCQECSALTFMQSVVKGT